MDLKTTRLAGFDLETTGVDVLSDRIVTASIVYIEPDGSLVSNYEWLVNPGVDIPQGASDVHGITNEVAQRDGKPPSVCVPQIVSYLRYFLDGGVPVVTFNGSYDFSLLNAECHRHMGVSLDEALGGSIPKLLIDSLVIDKIVHKYRRGSRKLTAVAEHYGVPLENAHESFDDSLAAARVAQKLWEKFPALEGPTWEELYDLQVTSYEEQMRGLEEYLLKEQAKDPEKYPDPIDISYSWPIRRA